MKELENISKKISSLNYYQFLLDQSSEDLLGMSLMQPLLKHSFLPFTNSSIRPFNMACLLNDIVINQRKRIIEFGSGISTILIGRLIQQFNFDAEVISIEHDRNWMNFIQTFLGKEDLGQIIRLVYAPLTSLVSGSNSEWYETKKMNLKENAKNGFDMVIIDGPPAWEKGKEEARLPALPFIINHLNENSIVYLDDADREGERSIIQKWENDNNIKFEFLGTLAYFSKGKSFNPAIK